MWWCTWNRKSRPGPHQALSSSGPDSGSWFFRLEWFCGFLYISLRSSWRRSLRRTQTSLWSWSWWPEANCSTGTSSPVSITHPLCSLWLMLHDLYRGRCDHWFWCWSQEEEKKPLSMSCDLFPLCLLSGLWNEVTTVRETPLTSSNRFWKLWRWVCCLHGLSGKPITVWLWFCHMSAGPSQTGPLLTAGFYLCQFEASWHGCVNDVGCGSVRVAADCQLLGCRCCWQQCCSSCRSLM